MIKTAQTQQLFVKVTPRADRNAIVCWSGDDASELAVRVTVAPEDGKANAAVIKLLAKSLGLARSRVQIVGGHSSRHKHLAIEMDASDFETWQRSLPSKPVK